jgi:putative redox protein
VSAFKVTLRRIGVCAFEAVNASGHRARVEGSPALAAKILERVANPALLPAPEASPGTAPAGLGMRPMELFLVSLAGCSAMDVVQIITRQREDLRDLVIEVEGARADATPAVYEAIKLRFTAHGAVNPAKLARAVDLAVGKYCSVGAMLKPDVAISVETAVAG